ncbi:hypothetical protein KSP40_PGU004388 [Platanthera guangdongensis]|uniref:Uncharacterized protein n=1 Tax=Platanthera guangdongensis TaxID=2320717 RepID=A0ABR2N4Z4_9ASPA
MENRLEECSSPIDIATPPQPTDEEDPETTQVNNPNWFNSSSPWNLRCARAAMGSQK